MGGVQVADLFAKLGLKPDRKAWAEGNKLIQGMKVAVAGFLGLKGVQAVGDMIKSVADKADKARKSAQSLGVTTAAIQELSHAADLSGAGFDSLRQAMTMLAKSGVKDVDATLMKLADRFAKMPDGPKKTRIAMEKLGKGGAELIPMLNEGSAGIAKMRAEARELGIVIGDETARGFEAFNDDQTRLARTIDGLKIQVVTALLPTLQGMVDSLRAWVTANREVIASALTVVVKAMVVAFKALGVVVAAAASLFEWFAEGGDAAVSVLIVLGAAMLTWAGQAAAAWVIGLGPVALIVAGVVAALAGIVFVVIKIVKHWDLLRAAVGRALSAIKDKVRGAWEAIKGFGRGVADVFLAIGGGIKGAFQAVIDWIADKVRWVTDKVDWVVEQARKVGRAIGSIFEGDGASLLPPESVNELRRRATGRSPSTAVPSASGSSTASVDVGGISIDVHAGPGMDEQALAVNVGKQVDERLRGVFRHVGSERGSKG